VFEAGDGPKDVFLSALRRDDLPAADRCRDGNGLLWFVLLDGGFSSVRGCCLKKSAYVLVAIAVYDATRLPIPVIWAKAAANRRASGSCGGRTRNLIYSAPKRKKKPYSPTTAPSHHQREPSPTRFPQIGLPPWRRHRPSALVAGPSREEPMGPRPGTSPSVAMELQLANPTN